MPRFAANLSFLFNEVPFLDRFGEAARAGFGAVEFAFGYDYPVGEIAARLAGNGLQQVLINAPPGDWAPASADSPRCPVASTSSRRASSPRCATREALACPRVHVMAGVLPPDADAARARSASRDVRAQPAAGRARGGATGRHGHHRADQHRATFRATS